VVLPEIEAAEAVSLIGPPLREEERTLALEQGEPVREIARFDWKAGS
jgi:hypothetical protein